ncbi:response regulator transcription factor [Arthrobacter sp. Z4-13]
MTVRGVAVVVEADDELRTCLSEILQQSGFVVRQASSGGQGVDTIQNHGPVLVILDMDLPDFDGIEAARRIRTFSDAYLIMIACSGTEEDIVMGLVAGADDYLGKPVRAYELRARIHALLRRPRGGTGT